MGYVCVNVMLNGKFLNTLATINLDGRMPGKKSRKNEGRYSHNIASKNWRTNYTQIQCGYYKMLKHKVISLKSKPQRIVRVSEQTEFKTISTRFSPVLNLLALDVGLCRTQSL